MKKFIKRALISATILCGGMTVTSCDSDTLTTILTNLATIILTGNNQTYTFTGTASMEMYDYDSSTNQYQENTKVSASVTMQPQITLYNDSTCTIKLGDFTIGSKKITNFTFSTYYYNGQIDPEGNYLTGGTCEVGGTSTNIDVTCIQGTITAGTNGAMKLTTIYFVIDDKMYKGTFTGTNNTTTSN